MKRFLCILIFSIVAGLLAISLLIHVESVQKSIKAELEKECSKLVERKVTIGSLDGVLPFVFSAHNIELFDDSGKKMATLSSVRLIPNWFSCIFGKIAFFKVDVDGIQILDDSHPKDTFLSALAIPSITSYLPNKKIAIDAFSLTDISLSSEPCERYQIHGSFFWNAKSEHLVSSFSLSSVAASTVNTKLRISKKEILAKCDCNVKQKDAQKLELPFGDSQVTFEISSKNRQLLDTLWNTKSPVNKKKVDPFFQGKLSVCLTPNDALGARVPVLDRAHFAARFDVSSELDLYFEIDPIKVSEKECSQPYAISSNIIGKAQNIQGISYILLQAKTAGRGDLELSDVEVNINCKKLKSLWAATVSLESKMSKSEPIPLHFETTLLSRQANQKQLLSFQNSYASFGKTTLSSDLDLLISSASLPLLKGKIEGQSADLSQLGKLFCKNISGKGAITAHFDVKSEQTAKISATLTDVRLPIGAYSFASDQLTLDATGCGSIVKPHLKARIQCAKSIFNHIEVNTCTLDTECDFAKADLNLPFDFHMQGMIDKGPFAVDLAGNFQKSNKDTIFALQKCSAFIANRSAKLTTPASLHMKREELTLTPLTLAWEKNGLFQCSASIRKDELAGTLLAQDVPLDFLHFFLPKTAVTGSVSLTGSLHGSKNAPEMHLKMKTKSLAVGTQKQGYLLPFDVHLACDANANLAQIKAEILNPKKKDQMPLALELNLPITFLQESCFYTIKEGESIDGKLQGKSEISAFFAPFLQEDEFVEGELNFDLDLKGTYESPDLKGTLSWSNGKLDMLKTGTIFADINAEATCYGNTLIVKSIRCTDEKKGQLTGQGKIALKSATHFPFVLHISTEEMELVRRDFAHVVASGKAELIGNFQKADLKGSFVATQAELNLTNDFSQTVPTLDFIYINHPDESRPQKPNFLLSLNLDVALPSCGKIIGRGLNSTWKGDLKILGTTDETQFQGKIMVDKGTFSFANKEFTLQEGSIDVSGDLFTQSRLNIVAKADLAQVRAQLFLRGSLDKPRIQLASVPMLQEREILSWILFNKPINKVSYMEGLQLAQVLLSMNGKASKFNIIDKFKKTFGIDHIDVSRTQHDDESPENDGVAVQVGKYISKSVFVKLSKDITNAANRVAIEANLHKNVSVEAEVGDDEEGQMSLMWKHDY